MYIGVSGKKKETMPQNSVLRSYFSIDMKKSGLSRTFSLHKGKPLLLDRRSLALKLCFYLLNFG